MKKLLIIGSVILAAAAIYYFATPKQKRLDDKDFAEYNDEAEVVEKVVVHEPLESLPLYYYKSDDVKCENLIPLEFEDIDLRYEFKEINAITGLLTHKIPEGYKSAFVPGTYLNKLKKKDGTLTLDISHFMDLGTGPCSYEARERQIRQTFAIFDDISKLDILTEGKPKEVTY
jgi:hypothetical protein